MDHRIAVPVLFAMLAALPFAYARGPVPGDRAEATAPGGATAPSLRSARGTVAASDPRICLEFPTNLQVIACAEKYLPQRRRSADS